MIGDVGEGVVAGEPDRDPAVEVGVLLDELGGAGGLDRLADLALALLEADAAAISVAQHDHEVLVGVAGAARVGPTGAGGLPRQLPSTRSLAPLVLEEDATVTIDDVALDPRQERLAALRDLGMQAAASAPLRADDGEIVGVVCVGTAAPRRWRAGDARTLELLAALATEALARGLEESSAAAAAQRRADVAARLRPELVDDLSVVLSGIETALHPDATPEIRDRALARARSDTLRVIDVLDALLRPVGEVAAPTTVTSLATLVDDAVRELDDRVASRVDVRVDDARIEVAGRLLERVVANLVRDAAARTTGPVVITATTDGGDAVLVVSRPATTSTPDDGEAPPLVVRELVDRLGGRLTVTADDGVTTAVTVPARAQSPNPSNAASSSAGS